MLNDIISNDFIDDRLTKFLNILSGGADTEILQLTLHSAESTPIESPLQLHIKQDSNTSPASSVAKNPQGKNSYHQSTNGGEQIEKKRQKRLLTYFLESLKEINGRFDDFEKGFVPASNVRQDLSLKLEQEDPDVKVAGYPAKIERADAPEGSSQSSSS